MDSPFAGRVAEFTLTSGIWLAVPLLVDISTGILLCAFLLVWNRKTDLVSRPALTYYPSVTLIIPVHDSAATLAICLESVFAQSYPTTRLEIICANNGSRDESFAVYQRFQNSHPAALLKWIELPRAGKSIALNAGICASNGTYVINVDSDARLDRDAVRRMVEALEAEPDLGAATGSITVNAVAGSGNRCLGFLHTCEAVEYLTAFHVGRQFQTLTNRLFTLSGAFSAFRRDTLLRSFLYSSRTVSEDTDLTFHLRASPHRHQGRIGCVTAAVAFVEPVASLSRLYSQRVRWQRGQLEVSSLYGFPGRLLDFTNRMLLADHTLALARMMWTCLFPFLCFLGYPLPLVFGAMFAIYLCYVLLDALLLLSACRSVGKARRRDLIWDWWIVFLLPLYRMLIYWFRIAGIITALTEPAGWQAAPPWEQMGKEVPDWLRRITVNLTRQRRACE